MQVEEINIIRFDAQECLSRLRIIGLNGGFCWSKLCGGSGIVAADICGRFALFGIMK